MPKFQSCIFPMTFCWTFLYTVLLQPQTFFFNLILFLIGGQLLYNIVMVSATHQHESAVGVQMSLPLEPPFHLPPFSVVREHWFELPEAFSRFPLAIYGIAVVYQPKWKWFDIVTAHVPYRCVLPRLSHDKREMFSMMPGREELLDFRVANTSSMLIHVSAPRLFREKKGDPIFINNICQIPWCKDYQHGSFQEKHSSHYDIEFPSYRYNQYKQTQQYRE